MVDEIITGNGHDARRIKQQMNKYSDFSKKKKSKAFSKL